MVGALFTNNKFYFCKNTTFSLFLQVQTNYFITTSFDLFLSHQFINPLQVTHLLLQPFIFLSALLQILFAARLQPHCRYFQHPLRLQFLRIERKKIILHRLAKFLQRSCIHLFVFHQPADACDVHPQTFRQFPRFYALLLRHFPNRISDM